MNMRAFLPLFVGCLCLTLTLMGREIAVVGAGYVGLVSGACFAQQEDNHVVIIENNKKKIDVLLKGGVPFYEPGLDALVKKGLSTKRIEFVETIEQACQYHPECFFLCVGTPSSEDGSADLSYVYKAAGEIGSHLKSYSVIIDKSTVPVGTAQHVKTVIQNELQRRNANVFFDVASNPEFLQEGSAVTNFMVPDRVVIGTDTLRAKNILVDLYTPFVKESSDILCMRIESAELTKYASNAMLATRISFMNQVARLADKVNADVEEVKKGMAKDRRIGPCFLNSGIGYGGSCFPKDVKALVHTGEEQGVAMTVVAEVDKVNFDQRAWFTQKVIDYYGDSLAHKHIGVWGLSFKPETDDIRYSPAIDVMKALLAKGAIITAYDPQAKENMQELFGDSIQYAETADEVLQDSDCLLLLTEWKEFLSYKPAHFKQLRDGVVFDGRNCFDPLVMTQEGISYWTVGRDAAKTGDLLR